MAITPIAELVELAVRLVNAGQHERARLVCEKGLSGQYSPHPALHQLLAVLDLRAGHHESASEHAARSLALRPDHLPTLLIAADVARARHDLPGAALALERAVIVAPKHPDAWFRLSLVRQDLHHPGAAVEALQRVLQLSPDRADAEVNLGIALQECGRVDEALQAYGRAYRLRSETFGRIAHALSTPSTGQLWLDLDALRAELARVDAVVAT